jgi:hypothetical protein
MTIEGLQKNVDKQFKRTHYHEPDNQERLQFLAELLQGIVVTPRLLINVLMDYDYYDVDVFRTDIVTLMSRLG